MCFKAKNYKELFAIYNGTIRLSYLQIISVIQREKKDIDEVINKVEALKARKARLYFLET